MKNLPKGWTYVKLGDVLTMAQYGLSMSSSDQGRYPMFRMNNFRDGKVIAENLVYVDLADKEAVKFLLEPNDILFNRTNSPALVGKTGLFSLPGEYVFASYLVRLRVNEKVADPRFINYFLNDDKTKQELKALSTAGVSQSNINPTSLRKKLAIPLPPLAEQQRIATILGACDRAIEASTLLLAKQEKRKEGLVHLILKLPSSDSDWTEVKLKDVATVIMGQSPSSSSYNTDGIGLPLIQGNADIKGRQTVPKLFTNAPTKRCVVGDIIMTVRAPVGAIAKSLHDGCLGRGVCAVRAGTHIDDEYLYQVMLAKESEWTKVEQGSTFTAIAGNDVKNTAIPLPKSKDEQHRIATTLSLCDKENKLLRQQLKLLQKQKKGLMQRLLTGQSFIN